MKFIKINDNPYAAPQAALTLETVALPVDVDSPGFPWVLIRQGLRNGTMAGLVASAVMLFVYMLRFQSGSPGKFSNLLATCGSFTVVTSSLGLFWGFNHAIIVWILRRWSWTANDDASTDV